MAYMIAIINANVFSKLIYKFLEGPRDSTVSNIFPPALNKANN
jgi:hypothetical protein